MMSYINEGDMLLVDGKHAVAISSDYTELYYDADARDMARYGLDYGVARPVVKVLIPETGHQLKVELRRVQKVEHHAEGR